MILWGDIVLNCGCAEGDAVSVCVARVSGHFRA